MFNTRGSSVNASKKYRLGDLPAIEYFEIQSVWMASINGIEVRFRFKLKHKMPGQPRKSHYNIIIDH